MKPLNITLRLGALFCLLLAFLSVVGWQGITHLRHLNAQIQNAVYDRWTEQQLLHEAYRLSAQNSQTTLQIFLMDDPNAIQPLLVQHAANTRRVTELINVIEPRLNLAMEKELFAAVKTARTPYIENYQRALTLLLTEQKRAEAARMMVNEVRPKLLAYQNAWRAFDQYEADEINRVMQQSKSDFAAGQWNFLDLLAIAGLMAGGIAAFAIRILKREMAVRRRAEKYLNESREMETRLVERTLQLTRTNETLVETSALLKALLANTNDFIYFKDLQSRFVHFSQAMLKHLRLIRVPELTGRTDFDFFAEVHARPAFEAEQEIIRTGQSVFNLEEKEVHLDGQVTWALTCKMPWRDPAGTIIGTMGITRDITERKQAQLALEELSQRTERRERMLTTTLSSLNDFAYIFDRKGRFLFANQPLLNLWGIPLEAAVGKNFSELGYSEDLARKLESQVQQVFETKQNVTDETVYTSPAGVKGCYEYIFSPAVAADGTVDFVVGCTRDITGRKNTEDALREYVRLASLDADVKSALAGGKPLAETLRLCSEALVHHLDGAFARVWTLNEAERMLELQASAGLYTHLDGAHSRVPVGKFKIGLIAEERKPHLTNQVIGDPRVGNQEWAAREGMVAFAGYPLLVEDRLVGVVAMFARHPLAASTLTALASVANDIAQGIARKRAGEALKESEERFHFLNDLTEATRSLVEPAQIMAVTARMLGEHLRASRCAYADVESDGERFTILHDYTDGCASTVGKYQLSLFGARAVAMLHGGQVLILRNMDAELLPDDGADKFNAIGIKAIISCPLVKQGKLRALMAVHQTTPRDWQPGEIAIVQEVVERCWATIERKRAEEALRMSEERLRAALTASGTGTYRWDIHTNELHWDESLDALFGLPPGRTTHSLETFIGTVHPNDRPGVIERCEHCAREGADFNMEFRVLWPDGSVHWLDDKGKTFFDATNQPLYMTGACVDITTRKRAEVELLEAKLFLRSALDALSAHIAILDEHGTIVEVNTAWNRFAVANGSADGRSIGIDYLKVCDAAAANCSTEASVVADGIRAVMAGQSDEFLFEYPCLGPKEQNWFMLRVTRFGGEGSAFAGPEPASDSAGLPQRSAAEAGEATARRRPVRVVVAHENISEQKRAEASLRESQQRLALATESAHVGIWDWDVVADKMTWDAQMYRLYGIREQDFSGAYDAWRKGLHPEDRQRSEAELTAALESRKDFHTEFRVVWAGGEVRHIEAHGTVLRAGDGSAKRMIGVNWDITERKKLETQLIQSQKMETVGKLAGGIAHEFNSILTAIMGQSELLLEDLPAGSPLIQNVTEISQAAARAATLTRQLLAYGRKQLLLPETLDLNRVLTNLEGVLKQLLGADMDVRIILALELHPVKADAAQIEQVIMNLVINARDAMPNGGKLTLETANATLDQEYISRFPESEVKAGDYVMLAITDTGTGMSDKIKARLFEPFFTTKCIGQGTGLGLSTCYGIVKQSGGHISVYSELGRGTTFKIYMPQVEAPAKISLPRLAAPNLPQGTETILLVEDDPALRAMSATLLKRLGYTVLTAGNGVEALNRLQDRNAGRIDLLFTDVVMPHMSGKELADHARTLYPYMKILFTSAYTENAIIHQAALDKGMTLLQKPFTPSALATKLRQVLS